MAHPLLFILRPFQAVAEPADFIRDSGLIVL